MPGSLRSSGRTRTRLWPMAICTDCLPTETGSKGDLTLVGNVTKPLVRWILPSSASPLGERHRRTFSTIAPGAIQNKATGYVKNQETVRDVVLS